MRCDFINRRCIYIYTMYLHYDKTFNIISIYVRTYIMYTVYIVRIMCISMKGQYIPCFQSCCVSQRNLMNFAVTKRGLFGD